jgi:predicted TIM-barrel fold metal-dependent hydrolase
MGGLQPITADLRKPEAAGGRVARAKPSEVVFGLCKFEQRSPSVIIDMDTHILPRDIYDYVEGPAAARKPVYEFDASGKLVNWSFPGWHFVEGTTPLWPPGSGAGYTGLSDIDARLEDHRKLGIDRQLLLPQYTATLFNYTLDPELAIAMAHSYNVSIHKLMKAYPDEFMGAALVALQDVPSAISEMEWAHRNGFQAVAIDKVFPVRHHAFSEALGSHRELWPFFRRAEQLGMPVVLHNVQHGHRISNIMLFQQDGLDIASPAEGHLSLMSLCTSGLFDDFPALRVVFTEAGSSFIKPLVERFDAAYSKAPLNYEDEDASARFHRRVTIGPKRLSAGKRLTAVENFDPKNKHPVSHYFRHNILFTIETEEAELADSIRYLGATQFLFATDYPHDDPGGRMKWKDVALLQDHPDITEADKALIRAGNALSILCNMEGKAHAVA